MQIILKRIPWHVLSGFSYTNVFHTRNLLHVIKLYRLFFELSRKVTSTFPTVQKPVITVDHMMEARRETFKSAQPFDLECIWNILLPSMMRRRFRNMLGLAVHKRRAHLSGDDKRRTRVSVQKMNFDSINMRLLDGPVDFHSLCSRRDLDIEALYNVNVDRHYTATLLASSGLVDMEIEVELCFLSQVLPLYLIGYQE